MFGRFSHVLVPFEVVTEELRRTDDKLAKSICQEWKTSFLLYCQETLTEKIKRALAGIEISIFSPCITARYLL
jgi:hypothetical protein